MGRTPYEKEVELLYNGKKSKKKVTFFGWEKLDYVEKIKKEFAIKK
jgi:hypothetical protein